MCEQQKNTLRIMREAEVRLLTGLSRQTRRDLSLKGMFPVRVELGERASGYLSDEIYDWIEGRRSKRSTPQAARKASYTAQEVTL